MTTELSQKKEEYLQRYLDGLEPGISREEIRKRRKALNFELRDAGCPSSWRKSAVRTFTEAAKEAHFADGEDEELRREKRRCVPEAIGVDWVNISGAEREYFRQQAREILGEREVQRLDERNRLLIGGVRVEYCINPGTASRPVYDLVRIHGDLPVEVALAGIKHENPRKKVRDRREESRPEPGAHDGSHVPGYHAEPVQA